MASPASLHEGGTRNCKVFSVILNLWCHLPSLQLLPYCTEIPLQLCKDQDLPLWNTCINTCISHVPMPIFVSATFPHVPEHTCTCLMAGHVCSTLGHRDTLTHTRARAQAHTCAHTRARTHCTHTKGWEAILRLTATWRLRSGTRALTLSRSPPSRPLTTGCGPPRHPFRPLSTTSLAPRPPKPPPLTSPNPEIPLTGLHMCTRLTKIRVAGFPSSFSSSPVRVSGVV